MKMLVCLLSVLVIGVAGCKKTESTAGSGQAVPVVAAADVNTGGQITCPVMGGKIDPKFKTVYKGKTVYFCCPGCIDTFNKDPNSYIGKLPQFKK